MTFFRRTVAFPRATRSRSLGSSARKSARDRAEARTVPRRFLGSDESLRGFSLGPRDGGEGRNNDAPAARAVLVTLPAR